MVCVTLHENPLSKNTSPMVILKTFRTSKTKKYCKVFNSPSLKFHEAFQNNAIAPKNAAMLVHCVATRKSRFRKENEYVSSRRFSTPIASNKPTIASVFRYLNALKLPTSPITTSVKHRTTRIIAFWPAVVLFKAVKTPNL